MAKEKIRKVDKDKTLRKLSAQEALAGENVMQQSMGVKPHESVCIISDTGKRSEAAVFFEAAKRFAKDVVLYEMAPRRENGEEPPEEIAVAMRSYPVSLLVTTKSLTHTKARHKATDEGGRVASLPGVTLDMIRRTLVGDFQKTGTLAQKVAQRLTEGKEVHTTSSQGTDVKMAIHDRAGVADTGFFVSEGSMGNLPAGEAFLAPVEGTAEGIIIIDGCSYVEGVPLDRPIKLTVKKGMAVKIEGGKAAKALVEALERVGRLSRNIAELGIGVNKTATVSGSILETEKVYGTVHIALGNNKHFGGTVDVPFHSDGVILHPVLEIDGKIILEDGKFNV